MSASRVCNILILVTLIVMAALTIQQAAGVSAVADAAAALRADPAAGPTQCLRSGLQPSIIASYVKGLKMWVARTADGPAGVDGGLVYLLSLPRCK